MPHSTYASARTLREAKSRARELRQELAHRGQTISHSQALERIAHELGYANWNIAAARLTNMPEYMPQLGDIVQGTYLGQSFMGEVLGVKAINGGTHFEVEIHCAEAIDVVTFDSFSSFRNRLRTTLDTYGRSVSFTSDKQPHMVINVGENAIV